MIYRHDGICNNICLFNENSINSVKILFCTIHMAVPSTNSVLTLTILPCTLIGQLLPNRSGAFQFARDCEMTRNKVCGKFALFSFNKDWKI